MPDQLFDELPILRELGDDLKAAFLDRGATSQPRFLASRAPGRWMLGAGGLAAALAGVVIAFVLAVQGGSPTPAGATAALYQAAAIAARRPVVFPADNQFYYVRYITTSSAVIRAKRTTSLTLKQFRAGPKAVVTIESQLWFSANRLGLIKSRVISVKFQTAADRRLWERLGRPSLAPILGQMKIGPLGEGHYLLGNIELTRRQLLAAPTDPRSLYARLYAAGSDSPAEVFTEIGDALRNRPAPPRLRAALYRTLALVPGVRLLGPTRDAIGRRGIAVAMIQHHFEDELIIDPTTSDMLEERGIPTNRTGHPIGPAEITTYLQRSVTDTTTTP